MSLDLEYRDFEVLIVRVIASLITLPGNSRCPESNTRRALKIRNYGKVYSRMITTTIKSASFLLLQLDDRW